MFASLKPHAIPALICLTAPALAMAEPVENHSLGVEMRTLTLPSGDQADVYAPSVPHPLRNRFTDAFPIVAFLQGALVDKADYNRFAKALAKQGFIVAVPNHYRASGPLAGLLFSEVNVVTDVLEQMVIEDADPSSPLFRIADTDRMGLAGHSFGGAVGIDAAAGECTFELCSEPYDRPEALKAAVFYGANRIDAYTGEAVDRDTSQVAVGLIQGTLDGVALPVKAERTLPTLERPHALISVDGANHYGICNENSPRDPVAPILDQAASIDLIARWAGLWLKAHLRQ